MEGERKKGKEREKVLLMMKSVVMRGRMTEKVMGRREEGRDICRCTVCTYT